MPDVRMEFDRIEDMIMAFRRAADNLETIVDNIQQLVRVTEDGALIGTSGQRLVDVVSDRLRPKVDGGRSKFLEMSRDLDEAMEAMRGSDRTSGRYFS